MQLPVAKNGKQSIFLAGSMDFNSESNWRKRVINEFNKDYNFFDPTITNHDTLTNSQMEKHIQWELAALELSDKVLLNFLSVSESPISLIELGMYVKTTKLIVVCPDKFYKSRYIKTLCATYATPFFTDVECALEYLKI